MALSNIDYVLNLYSFNDQDNIEQSNVFYYKAGLGFSSSAEQLVQKFNAQVVPDLLAVMSVHFSLTSVYAYNLVDTDDFHQSAYSSAFDGERTGDADLPFVGWYFRYFRPNRDVRNGRKTFGPISDGDSQASKPSSAALALLATLSDTLATPLDALVGFYYPCIAKTTLITNPSPPPAQRRVPDTLYVCTEVAFQKISSQNSRKD